MVVWVLFCKYARHMPSGNFTITVFFSPFDHRPHRITFIVKMLHRSPSAVFALIAMHLLLVGSVSCTGTITQYIYEDETCTGTPSGSYSHPDGTCGLGGIVYQCATGKQCLTISTYESTKIEGKATKARGEGTDCSGTLISEEALACDECIGGSDTTVSTVVKGCSTPHPTIYTCLQSGTCAAGCQNDSGNLTIGCTSDGPGAGVDVAVVPCSVVLLQDYQDYETCSGSMLSQTAFPVGVCMGGVKWEC